MKKQMYTLVLAGLCLGAQPVQTMNWENAKYYGGQLLGVPGALGRGALWATGYVPRTVLGYTLEPMLNLLNLQSWVKKWNTYSDTTKNAIATTLVTTPAMMYILYKNPELLNTIIVSSGYQKWERLRRIMDNYTFFQYTVHLAVPEAHVNPKYAKEFPVLEEVLRELGINPQEAGSITFPLWFKIIESIRTMLEGLYSGSLNFAGGIGRELKGLYRFMTDKPFLWP